MKKIKIVAVAALMALILTAMQAGPAVRITDLEARGQAANETENIKDYLGLSSGTAPWQSPAGFYHGENDEFSLDSLADARTILQSNLKDTPCGK